MRNSYGLTIESGTLLKAGIQKKTIVGRMRMEEWMT